MVSSKSMTFLTLHFAMEVRVGPDFEMMHLDDRNNAYPYSCHVEFSSGQDLYISPHYHYEIELLFFYSGKAFVNIGSQSFEISKNEMALINAMEVHSILVQPGSDTRYIVIMFNPSLLPSSSGTIFESKYITPFTMKGSTLKRFYSSEDLRGTFIADQFQTILDEFSSRQYGFEFAIRLGIYNISLWILRRCYEINALCFKEGFSLSKEQTLRFEKLFDFVENHFAEEIDSSSIVDICHINYSYFARQFKLMMGRTFKEYLNFIRISQAERILLTTNLPITEIALAVGYADSSYFIKQFKKEKGISPMQIRKVLHREILG